MADPLTSPAPPRPVGSTPGARPPGTTSHGRSGRPGPRRRQTRWAGLTLVELMIGMAVVAVLASLAFPALVDHRNRLRIATVVNDLSAIQIAVNARQADTGSYPASLAEIGWTRLDPWGRPYEYLRLEDANRGQARKDRNLVPINTDYDLYSVGPDGRSVPPLVAQHSRDDIIRAANGQYVGPAEGF